MVCLVNGFILYIISKMKTVSRLVCRKFQRSVVSLMESASQLIAPFHTSWLCQLALIVSEHIKNACWSKRLWISVLLNSNLGCPRDVIVSLEQPTSRIVCLLNTPQQKKWHWTLQPPQKKWCDSGMSSHTRSSRFQFECISTSCWRWDTHPTAKLHPPHTSGTAEALVQMDMDHQGRQIFYPTEPQNSLRKIQRWWIIIIIIMGASEAFQCHHSLPFQYPDTTCVPRQLKSSSTPGSSSYFAASKQHSLKFIVAWNHMGMDQYLLIPFLGGWTSIYQLFWCSPGVQGFDTLPYEWI